MTKIKKAHILPPVVALLAWGCASFQSGAVPLERDTLKAMREDKALKPFAKMQVIWQNYPYRNPTDSIGEGSLSPKPIKPAAAESEDLEYFRSKAEEILAKAGLYDPQKGTGTLKLTLTTAGRWTYHDLFKSYLVDTAFVFILPSSIKAGYELTAQWEEPSGTLKTEITAKNKTAFHLLLAPLYPFLSPGAREKSLIRKMLWQTSTEIYGKMKR